MEVKKRPGPVPKGERSTQVSVTIPPKVYNALKSYMSENGLNNRSGVITKLLKAALELA